jgi:hypothetical protein
MDMIELLTPAATALGVTSLLCLTAHRAWREWLDLKRLELARRHSAGEGEGDVGLRIELADLRERLKKLEAIASGVEL